MYCNEPGNMLNIQNIYYVEIHVSIFNLVNTSLLISAIKLSPGNDIFNPLYYDGFSYTY